jgi:hypothetical protein
MSKDMKFRVNGAQDLEIEWPDGRKLAVLPYGKGVDGLADELTRRGNFHAARRLRDDYSLRTPSGSPVRTWASLCE